MIDLGALQALRRDEEAAKAQLEAGCRADLRRIERLIESPLRKARCELEACLGSFDALEPILVANLKREYAESVGLRCASDAFANASVRFRARFGMYADSLLAAERRFVEAVISNHRKQRVSPRAPRRITMPRIELDDELSILPEREPSLSEVDGWIADLEERLQSALESTVATARLKLLNRGSRDLARTLVAVRLAALDHSPNRASGPEDS